MAEVAQPDVYCLDDLYWKVIKNESIGWMWVIQTDDPFFTLWCPCMAAMSLESSANWKWQFVSTEAVSVSAENAKMLAHSLQQLLAEQVRVFSHSLQSRRLRLTKWWLMVYKSWQPATIALIQIDLSVWSSHL